MAVLPADPSSVGIYGKIPAQGDFVRVNASDPLGQAVDQWLQQALEVLQRASADVPPDPTYFVYRPVTAGAPGSLVAVGALVASRDRVGRQYPLAVYARVDAAAVAHRLSSVPLMFTQFLQDAAALLADAPRADANALTVRSRALRYPGAAETAQADAVCRHTLDAAPVTDVYRRLFGDALEGRHCFAFKTFMDACDTARSHPAGPGRPAITLDCPIPSDVELFTWLELARRRMYGAPMVPSYVWREGSSPRLLLALGTPPPAVFRYLARPDDTAPQLWPLTTARGDSLEMARRALAEPYRRALDAPGPLEPLLAVLAR